MPGATQADQDKAQAVAIIKDFHDYFSSPLPFTEGPRFVIPHGLMIVPLPEELGGLTIETFNHMYERVTGILRAQYASGVKLFAHRLVKPGPEVRVSGNTAAVLTGFCGKVDDHDILHAVSLCLLHRRAGESGNPWRISGIVDSQHTLPDMPLPPVEAGSVSEIMAPFDALLKHIRAQEWDAITPLLLPNAGAMIAEGSQDPVTLMWPEFIKRLQAEAETGPVAEKKLFDCGARRCGNLAFVWAPFRLIVERKETAQGVTICAFRLEGEKWLIASFQETTFA
ncbi:uncharacterized protein E0L32_006097 [Thyridium curvatum]|uniref:Uncharacterized protein n=1 Tax=Thyridium curvatum TaxID=1093900 RepID=A0A507B0W2_9PEZI|nr:uncharacterized protein E0L32_006097 [Thyridium curvatum]TPX13367.1 hypothetical protein E0L32_006097 [Thyridium curvatum]